VFQSAFKQVAISIEIGYSGYIIEPQPQATYVDSRYSVVGEFYIATENL